MAKLHGKNMEIAISDDGGTTWTDISDVCNSVEFEDATEAGEVTNFDSIDDYQEYLDGLNSMTFSAEGYFDVAQFTAVRTAKLSGDAQMRLRPEGSATSGLFQVIFEVKGITIGGSFSVADPAGMSIGAQPSGAPTYGVTP
jgi:hypothetical protein